jgi:hypothetical protein
VIRYVDAIPDFGVAIMRRRGRAAQLPDGKDVDCNGDLARHPRAKLYSLVLSRSMGHETSAAGGRTA